MGAKTVAVKARLLDLTTGVLELVRDGNRDAYQVCEVLQVVKDNPGFFRQFFAQQTPAVVIPGWQAFYHNYFDLEPDLSNVRIPEKQGDFDRLIVIAKGLTPNRVYSVCAEQFSLREAHQSKNLNLVVARDERESTQHYAIWVRDRVEAADKKFENLSANQIKEQGLKTETLLEYLLHGLKFWSETGRYLGITLCSGSRSLSGLVPCACWSGDEFLFWCDPDDSLGDLCAREVVS